MHSPNITQLSSIPSSNLAKPHTTSNDDLFPAQFDHVQLRIPPRKKTHLQTQFQRVKPHIPPKGEIQPMTYPTPTFRSQSRLPPTQTCIAVGGSGLRLWQFYEY
ncbi:hypothetical protein E2C01_096683 [Portunus trituberculatus]|uniref:Uncharacterized protein n=1 Tax=Portunus trituberculatus TaxID=210409 RepID=A0A5B7K938_PORTR|nr:hypothetical protein [Portunus trituberculatus]